MRKYQLFLTVRYLRKRILNLLCVLAVALSVMVLIVVLSVLWGFDREFRARIRGTLSDIVVDNRWGEGISDYEELQRELEAVHGVKATAPYIEQLVLVSHRRSIADYATVRGVDLAQEIDVGNFRDYLDQTGKSHDFLLDNATTQFPGALVGSEICRELALIPSSVITLLSAWSGVEDSPAPFTVVGKFETRMYEYDRRLIYIPLAAAQSAFGMDERCEVSGISVALTEELSKDYEAAEKVKDKIQELLGRSYRVETWREKRKTFLSAIVLERRVTGFISGLSFLLGMTTIMVTMIMAVKEKTRDIGILRALGAPSRGVMSIFLLKGFLIGVIGSAVGITTGFIFNSQVNRISDLVYKLTGFSIWPSDIYYIDEIPTYTSPVGIALIALMAIAISLLASLIPARMAAKLDPIKALRYE